MDEEKRENVASGISVLLSEQVALEHFYKTAKIVPMRFTPTGEITFITLEMRDFIEKSKQKIK